MTPEAYAACIARLDAPPRTLAEIALTDTERDAILARLRADRLARGGRPPPVDPERVARSVIASQNIAGVRVPLEWMR